MTPLQKALTNETKMESYLLRTDTKEIISDIKAYHNADRTVIATAAMQGLCALPNKGTFGSHEEGWAAIAKHSVDIADALMAELKK